MHQKRFNFNRMIRRFDGENGGGSSSAATTTATGIDTEPAGTQTAAQTESTETQPFKSFASEADYQREIDARIQQALKTHEEKLKGKLTPAIRKQLEAEANMTAEQKVQAQIDQLAADKKELAKEKVRIKAETLFAARGISEEERQPMLDSIVDDDEEGSVKRATALLDAIEKATNEKIKAAMAAVQTPGTSTSTNSSTQTDVGESIGKKLGRATVEARKGSQKAIDYYKIGG